ncbi:Uncharacterized protein TCM_031950 [Theobroma cacao]|uniref:Reverse transcriptase Ty1/copia-type domain-containing protein n=1 Tax=Theobroma cacao TaxID=3641 RepID=A0A061F8K5_THECC|nr:Uncharacterized protein TCM_031950 [Theobroma cacao]
MDSASDIWNTLKQNYGHQDDTRICNLQYTLENVIQVVKSQIILMDLIPALDKVYSLVLREEAQRNLMFQVQPTLESSTILVGFPDDLKFTKGKNNGRKGKAIANNVSAANDVLVEEYQVDQEEEISGNTFMDNDWGGWGLFKIQNDVVERKRQHILMVAKGLMRQSKVKLNAAGDVERFKARLVVKGYNQVPACNWSLSQLDVNNAFLNGHLKEDVYMELPQGYIVKGECPPNTKKYALDLLIEQGLLEAKPVSTPIDYNHKLTKVKDEEKLPNPTNYRQLINKLGQEHLLAAHRVLKYPKASPGQGILMKSKSNMEMLGYCDSDLKSKKQSVVARSSAEAE